MTAFEPMDFFMISIGGRIFGGNFFITRYVCVVIHAEIGKNLRVWHVQEF